MPVVRTGSESDTPGPATERVELVEQIFACARLLRTEVLSGLRDCHLSESEFWLLRACQRERRFGIGQNKLATAVGVSPARVSGLVEGLRRRGLLEGSRPAHDRRRQLWHLTPAGQSTLESATAALADRLDRLEGVLGDAGLAALVQLFEAVTSAIAGRVESPGGCEIGTKRGAAA